jgi:hypothetical protein
VPGDEYETSTPPPPKPSVDETPLELEPDANAVSEAPVLAPQPEEPVAEPAEPENAF